MRLGFTRQTHATFVSDLSTFCLRQCRPGLGKEWNRRTLFRTTGAATARAAKTKIHAHHHRVPRHVVAVAISTHRLVMFFVCSSSSIVIRCLQAAEWQPGRMKKKKKELGQSLESDQRYCRRC
jgi:hypothetical protein